VAIGGFTLGIVLSTAAQATLGLELQPQRAARDWGRPKAGALVCSLSESAERVSENTAQAREPCAYDASCHSSRELTQCRDAQHQFVVTARRRPRPPVRHV